MSKPAKRSAKKTAPRTLAARYPKIARRLGAKALEEWRKPPSERERKLAHECAYAERREEVWRGVAQGAVSERDALRKRIHTIKSTIDRIVVQLEAEQERSARLLDALEHAEAALRNARATLRLLATGGLKGVCEAGCMFCLATPERSMLVHEDHEVHVEGCPIAARLAELDALLGVQAEAQGEPSGVKP